MTPRERPILFSGAMVRALLDGRKTQTRRVVKPQPDEDGLARLLSTGKWEDTSAREYRNAYGERGDRLWVRETFASAAKNIVAYQADARAGAWMGDGDGGRMWVHHGYVLEAPSYRECFTFPSDTLGLAKFGGRWRPSIHMPRWACRILLELVTVRVERLQDISRADAKAEGFLPSEGNGLEFSNGRSFGNANEAFRDTWDSINAKRGYGWDANPWVWALTFKRVIP